MGGNTASLEGSMAFSREGIGVEGDKRVLGLVLLEGVIEGQETGKIFGIGNKGGPD